MLTFNGDSRFSFSCKPGAGSEVHVFSPALSPKNKRRLSFLGCCSSVGPLSAMSRLAQWGRILIKVAFSPGQHVTHAKRERRSVGPPRKVRMSVYRTHCCLCPPSVCLEFRISRLAAEAGEWSEGELRNAIHVPSPDEEERVERLSE